MTTPCRPPPFRPDLAVLPVSESSRAIALVASCLVVKRSPTATGSAGCNESLPPAANNPAGVSIFARRVLRGELQRGFVTETRPLVALLLALVLTPKIIKLPNFRFDCVSISTYVPCFVFWILCTGIYLGWIVSYIQSLIPSIVVKHISAA